MCFSLFGEFEKQLCVGFSCLFPHNIQNLSDTI